MLADGPTPSSACKVYWPGASNVWQEPQSVRVLWMVNMLTDECDDSNFMDWDTYQEAYPDNDEDDYEQAHDKYCETHRTMDDMRPVQIYYENWYLAGMSVREDHGLDVAIAYPHTSDTQPYNEDALWGLSWGLGQQFIPGRACEKSTTLYDGLDDSTTCLADSPVDLPDISVFKTDKFGDATGNSTIKERFAYGAAPGGNGRWGIPANALEVQDYRYDHVDWLSYMSANVTPDILKTKFKTTDVPTLLFAREERYRLGSLEGAVKGDTGITLTLDEANYPVRTVRGMSLAPYLYQDGEWMGYSSSDYYLYLGDQLRVKFMTDYPSATSEEVEGRVAVWATRRSSGRKPTRDSSTATRMAWPTRSRCTTRTCSTVTRTATRASGWAAGTSPTAATRTAARSSPGCTRTRPRWMRTATP